MTIAPLSPGTPAAHRTQLDSLLRGARRALVGPGEHLEPVHDRILDASVDPRRVLLGAFDPGGAVGILDAVLHAPEPGDLFVAQLAVARTHRHRGIGRALVRAAIEAVEGREGPLDAVWAAVRSAEGAALAFWTRLGLEPEPEGGAIVELRAGRRALTLSGDGRV